MKDAVLAERRSELSGCLFAKSWCGPTLLQSRRQTQSRLRHDPTIRTVFHSGARPGTFR
ncbi:hypothetical protein LA76x_0487 [Lysobacter antibioticus]|uniref:Uncharacterized protein n=1 Tax=Lysobacter antibioticus TaxID=84531 RepID=A0A0S2F541_LYSAN|nr:hypothetical protein LA76x_0487 [Lysobacter antibioticus]